jgi:hypothetical protein
LPNLLYVHDHQFVTQILRKQLNHNSQHIYNCYKFHHSFTLVCLTQERKKNKSNDSNNTVSWYAHANFKYRCCVNLLLQKELILCIECACPIAFNIWFALRRLWINGAKICKQNAPSHLLSLTFFVQPTHLPI